jgi:tRNA-dihydrouridine synthase 3
MKRHESEDIFGVQLDDFFAPSFTKVCQVLKENDFKVDFVDVNCDRPLQSPKNKGFGCGLLSRLDHFEHTVRSLDILMDVPITCKMRTGVIENIIIAHDIIPYLKNWGVSMITVRTV